MKLFAFGLGYTAREYIARHGSSFDAVFATVRSLEAAAPAAPAVKTFVFGKDDEEAAIDAALRDCDVVLVSVPPSTSADPVLARYGRRIRTVRHKQKIIYLSTVGVYGDRYGEWVDEERLPMPKSARSKARLQTEKAWLAVGRDADKTLHVLRLAGIYGPGRNALAALKEGTARRVVQAGQVFNRIHVADICTAIEALVRYDGAGDVWNVSDDEPAPPQDVVTFAAELLGVEPPPEQGLAEASLSPLARSFYAENKRVANDKIKRKLGVQWTYPTYREGLRALYEAGEGRAEAGQGVLPS